MADIHSASSTYDTGTNDTYTSLDENDDVLAAHQNGPASAIVAIETILGTGTTLKGSLADLVARLAVALANTGKLNDFSSSTKTTFPGTVSEGMTGVTSLTAGKIVRMHATLDRLESTGMEAPSGGTGNVVTETNTQTLTNKTLTTPTIGNFTNATHTHISAATGGILTGNAGYQTDVAWSGSLSSSTSASTATVALTIRAGARVVLMASLTNNAAVTNPSIGDIYIRLKADSTVVAQKRINPSGAGPAADASIHLSGAYTEATGGSITYSLDITRAAGGAASAFNFVDVGVTAFTVV